MEYNFKESRERAIKKEIKSGILQLLAILPITGLVYLLYKILDYREMTTSTFFAVVIIMFLLSTIMFLKNIFTIIAQRYKYEKISVDDDKIVFTDFKGLSKEYSLNDIVVSKRDIYVNDGIDYDKKKTLTDINYKDEIIYSFNENDLRGHLEYDGKNKAVKDYYDKHEEMPVGFDLKRELNKKGIKHENRNESFSLKYNSVNKTFNIFMIIVFIPIVIVMLMFLAISLRESDKFGISISGALALISLFVLYFPIKDCLFSKYNAKFDNTGITVINGNDSKKYLYKELTYSYKQGSVFEHIRHRGPKEYLTFYCDSEKILEVNSYYTNFKRFLDTVKKKMGQS